MSADISAGADHLLATGRIFKAPVEELRIKFLLFGFVAAADFEMANLVAHLHTSRAAVTTFSAASFMVSATIKFKPLSFRIFLPSSTLVPSRRNTIVSVTFWLRAAC